MKENTKGIVLFRGENRGRRRRQSLVEEGIHDGAGEMRKVEERRVEPGINRY